jgi:hypothetical protein
MAAIEIRPEPLPVTLTTGVCPRGAQVRALAGLSVCPASSAKQIHAPSLRAILLPVATSTFSTWPPRRHRVPPHGGPVPGESSPSGAAATPHLSDCRRCGTSAQSASILGRASTAGPRSSPPPLDLPTTLVPVGRSAAGSAWHSGRVVPVRPTPRPRRRSTPAATPVPTSATPQALVPLPRARPPVRTFPPLAGESVHAWHALPGQSRHHLRIAQQNHSRRSTPGMDDTPHLDTTKSVARSWPSAAGPPPRTPLWW